MDKPEQIMHILADDWTCPECGEPNSCYGCVFMCDPCFDRAYNEVYKTMPDTMRDAVYSMDRPESYTTLLKSYALLKQWRDAHE